MTEKCIEWFWKSNDNPFSTMESAQWNRYSDIENTIIEEAFTTLKKAYVILDDYHIDFEHRVQISNDDKSKQRPVKRVEINKDEGRLREARFMPNPLVSTNWENRKREMVEKAILGILHEGKLAGKQCEAKWIIQQLEKVKDQTKKEIGECCIYLYSLESFLYKILNHTMRLIGNKNHENVWRSKIETLGPFAFLLYYYLSYENLNHRTSTIVYRGAQLTDEMIAEYQYVTRSKDSRRSFQTFTSCSRNRAKAEQFGNTLFVLKAETRTSYRTLNMDISSLSAYPEEEEVLIRPGRSFKIERVEFEKTKKKHVIYLTLISTSETN
ncbi:unnamed protein product [Rotaria sp. Silwood2]|nr:unnamed protein product [Rotaria sp. Silwood2]CAF3447230.1 unnamed protein product [Rotaria sp. Silwood2]CAF4162843.1 unnamed protein product [Rotaria sp. Silwood2]